MKKFISMVMAAAMVVSLVPATAFAKGDVTATAKVVDAAELKKGESAVYDGADGPEVQLKIKDADYQKTYKDFPTVDVTVTLDNAEFKKAGIDTVKEFLDLVRIKDEDGVNIKTTNVDEVTPATGGTTTTVTYERVWERNYKMAVNAGATGIMEDGKYTAFDSMKEIPAKAAESVAEQVKALEDAGYILTMIDGTSKYVLFGANNSIKDVKAVPTEKIAGTPEKSVEDQVNEKVAASATFVKEVKKYDKVAAKDRKVAVTAKENDIEDDEITFTFTGFFKEGDIISIDLISELTKTSEGTKATVSVDSKMVTLDDAVFASILGRGLKASVKKTVDVAEDEKTELHKTGLKLESVVGDFEKGQEITLKISKGFEFVKGAKITVDDKEATVERTNDNELTVTVAAGADDEIVIKGIEIEATSAKSGAVATITVKSSNWDSATVEVAKVVDYKVSLTVDEDEDVPVIYSGVNVDNYGITDDSDHVSLEVTAEETFPGAWSMRKGFNFELPEGVYVTDIDVTKAENFKQTNRSGVSKNEDLEAAWVEAFTNAYQDGDHVNFEFEKRVFDDVNTDLEKDPAKLTFTLTLVADPGFEGDVVLKLTGDLVDAQEVTIAKFVKPYTVKAEQNDLKIDYRYTEVPTAITITEAEAGLWAKKEAKFWFTIDRGDMINFEDDATFEVDKDSELEVDDFTNEKDGQIGFTVDEESDEAATVTIKDMQLFMQRNIPAGPYDLTIGSSLADKYEEQKLFAPDEKNCTLKNHDDDKECYVGDVCDYSDVVKEAFVNIITAGREVDDASFTTKVVVPVGESYIISGEKQITLDVPAYISAAGYTMLPVRAVAVALGINTNNVLWDGPTKTVTILYGQRIITMVAGQKVVYVNGSAIPASASVEIVNGRTFLPMRDLATALGVTDITWDAATKTATLNGNQK